MFDAGESAQIAYMKSGLGWNKKMKIFCYPYAWRSLCRDLGIVTNNVNAKIEQKFLDIFGPSGIEEFIAANIKNTKF